MPSLSGIPCWYIALAIVWSGYQAYRGFMIQKLLTPFQNLTNTQKVLLLSIADAFTFFVCSFSGFLALFAFRQLAWPSTPVAAETSSVLLIFLLLYGIAGITGKLPELLHALKLQGH
jgi:hypothetical protein